jgi:hypothetical protein
MFIMHRSKVFILIFDGADLAVHCLSGAQNTGALLVCRAEKLVGAGLATD